jgi:hypothetical protein
MMIPTLLSKLKADPVLTELLQPTVKDSKIYPNASETFGPCIVYTSSPMTGGEVKSETVQLKVNYPPAKEETGRAIVRRLYQLLDFTDENSTGWSQNGINLMSSILMGGGELDFGEFIQRTLIFNMKWRFLTDGNI